MLTVFKEFFAGFAVQNVAVIKHNKQSNLETLNTVFQISLKMVAGMVCSLKYWLS